MTAYMQPSQTVEWSTPQEFVDGLSEIYGDFTLDVAASDWNHKCEEYFTMKEDGLEQEWKADNVWCNPPSAWSCCSKQRPTCGGSTM